MESSPPLTPAPYDTEPEFVPPSNALNITDSPSMQRLDTVRTRRIDPDEDFVNMPSRILSNEANMAEYTEETALGEIPTSIVSRTSGKVEKYELVTFKINDPENPKNWSKPYKWYCTCVVAFTCFVVAFCSGVVTADLAGVGKSFNVSEEVTFLTITVFVVGFGVGPLVFAPMSEVFGRQPVYTSTLLVAVVFTIPGAVAKNIGTLLVTRAIDGIAFSAPIVLVGGTLADLWTVEERGVPMAVFSAAPFVGPAIGPLVGGFLSDAKGWRWLYWIQLIMSGTTWILITFTLPETYAPTILSKRAKKIRKETGNARVVTEQQLNPRPFKETLYLILFRPMQLLVLEPIVFLVALYMSVLYGLLYMFFVAFPVIYQEGKGYTAGITGLMFIPLALGVTTSSAFSPLVNKHYLKMCAKHGPNPPPELRLYPMMFSCWFVPIGLFIFAWTSYSDVLWLGPAIAGFPVGLGFIFIYNSANNYIVDVYQHQAASALAAKTFVRSLWGAGCVLFTVQMYHTCGYEWAGSILAFISLACCGIPFLFFFWGEKIRRISRFAYSPDEENTPGTKG
ncbi:Major facilitator superfamily multidrug transporter NAG3 [Hyphodiscus hymeniophilus]|uniref:Major facilitator superfamily multidrug transporter NAG3 n=1 Tax=Hyphodiscus hymeniophilus TaxID=353542 RepID=A0A9P6SM38_9HELO|nr:Major facilitator superfamily multidrug transporter NAG3 [Hyphodiscus hymeniophilus]